MKRDQTERWQDEILVNVKGGDHFGEKKEALCLRTTLSFCNIRKVSFEGNAINFKTFLVEVKEKEKEKKEIANELW